MRKHLDQMKSLGMEGIKYFTGLFSDSLKTEKILDEWHKSFVVPIFKHKIDITPCANYHSIKLISHAVKV